MKRREWLKGLCCAPLMLVPSNAVPRPTIVARPTNDVLFRREIEDRITVEVQGTVISNEQLADTIIKTINDAHRRGRFPL